MGQKVHPTGIRLGIVKDWTSTWYADSGDYADYLNTDLEIRDFIKKRLSQASVSRVQISRPAHNAVITVHTARPGIVIGKKGEDIDRLRKLFDAFNQKREILNLLDQCVHGKGIQIFIGEESGYQMLDECSLVTAPYSVDGQVLGVLGVIGPTRMAYERVIPIVDATARILSAALNPKD